MYLNILVYILLILQKCVPERIITTLKYSKHRVKPVIVNGEPVSLLGSVPYIVSIKVRIRAGPSTYLYSSICGGSIIHVRKVLTAAHCFESKNFAYAKNPSSLAVVAGELRNIIKMEDSSHDNFRSNGNAQWRKISSVVLHPYFNFPLDDIAVVFVSTDWHFSDFISSIKLARIALDYPDSCYASGYGRIEHSKPNRSKVLLRAKIEVLPRNRCNEIWEVQMDEFICTSSVATDVAIGDSGGPLACRGTSDPEEEPGKELLVGVTGGKNFDLSTIFTRVSAYTDWIEQRNKGCDLQIWYVISYLFFCLLNK